MGMRKLHVLIAEGGETPLSDCTCKQRLICLRFLRSIIERLYSERFLCIGELAFVRRAYIFLAEGPQSMFI